MSIPRNHHILRQFCLLLSFGIVLSLCITFFSRMTASAQESGEIHKTFIPMINHEGEISTAVSTAEQTTQLKAEQYTDDEALASGTVATNNPTQNQSNTSLSSNANNFLSAGGNAYVGGGNGSLPIPPADNPELFMQRTVLPKMGITDSSGNRIAADTGLTLSLGSGVLVGVFDTSPFTHTGIQTITIPNTKFTLVVNNEVGQTLPAASAGQPSLAEHGMFVSSIIHEAAPQADIILFRVMNENGVGDVNTLVTAINKFIDEVERRKVPAVINMSLGGKYNIPTSLSTALERAKNEGIVMVAATGNESANQTTPNNEWWPSNYAGVTAVAASTTDYKRACYSNKIISAEKGLSAPGGGPSASSGTNCDNAAFKTACEQGQCLVGQDSHGDYYYVAGTSFATPLISGLAALIKGDQETNQVTRSSCTADSSPEIQQQVSDAPLIAPEPDSWYLGAGIAQYEPPYWRGCGLEPHPACSVGYRITNITTGGDATSWNQKNDTLIDEQTALKPWTAWAPGYQNQHSAVLSLGGAYQVHEIRAFANGLNASTGTIDVEVNGTVYPLVLGPTQEWFSVGAPAQPFPTAISTNAVTLTRSVNTANINEVIICGRMQPLPPSP